MPNPNNIKAHKFPKGKSGNPKGRPKKLPELDVLLINVLGEKGDSLSQAEQILAKLVQMAKRGDVRAAEVLLDRAYGKTKQTVELPGGKDGKPFSITLNL